MTLRAVRWVLIALLGIAPAAGVAALASSIAGQHFTLSSEPAAAGFKLAPRPPSVAAPVTKHRKRRPVVRPAVTPRPPVSAPAPAATPQPPPATPTPPATHTTPAATVVTKAPKKHSSSTSERPTTTPAPHRRGDDGRPEHDD